MARRLIAPALPSWVGDLPVYERVLPNGLKALVLPRPQSPVVVCDLYYPVGSVHEPSGRTGLAHFVEHMLFKGTARFPKGQIDRLAFLAAGQTNAETSEDSTHYWFAFPADRWELALAIEADRMQGARFDPREVEAERSVIAEERARDLDSPLGRLDQTHLAVSYLVHPYRNPILGWPEDLRRTTVDDLTSFYETHYRPDGAVMVIVGSVDPEKTLDLVASQFQKVAPGTIARPPLPVAEPRQNGRRDFSLIEPDSVARGLLGWHSVPRGHPDGPALDVLSDILSSGRRARLWEILVDRDHLAMWIEAAQEPSRLAGQFLIQVEAVAGVDVARIESAVFAILGEMAAKGPTDEELVRSRNRLEAAWRWEQEDIFGLATGLGQVALWDDWRAWQAEHRAALAVTADDVRRVTQTYLQEGGLTVGWSLPREAGRVTSVAPAMPIEDHGRTRTAKLPPIVPLPPESQIDVRNLHLPSTASTLADYAPKRAVMPNGLRVVTETRPGTGTVSLDLWVDSGILREAKPGLAFFVSRLREEGTTTRSPEALFGEIEDVGGTLDIGSTGVSVCVRAEDLAMAVELMADVMLRPAFPADTLDWTRKRIGSELRADRDDPSFRADGCFRGLIYGDHPYGREPRGSVRDLARIDHNDVKKHHKTLVAADRAAIVAVGDFDPRVLRGLLRTHFGKWAAQNRKLVDPPPPALPSRRRVRRVRSEGEQVHLLIGHLGITRLDPDYDAMVVLDHILGSGPGFTDRLSRILRDEMGLAYSVGGGMTDSADLEPGYLRIYVGTSPEDAHRATIGVIEQIEAMHEGKFADDEVKRAKDYLAGSWVFDYQTISQRADRLLELERRGQPLNDPIDWPTRIARITPDQVRAAAKKHLHPRLLTRVEYGPLEENGRKRR